MNVALSEDESAAQYQVSTSDLFYSIISNTPTATHRRPLQFVLDLFLQACKYFVDSVICYAFKLRSQNDSVKGPLGKTSAATNRGPNEVRTGSNKHHKGSPFVPKQVYI